MLTKRRKLSKTKKRQVSKTNKMMISNSHRFKNITATIDADCIRHNINYLQNKCGTEIMPVIKANAYGHGMIQMSKILRNAGINMIGVATLGEAIYLRENGDTGIIVAWLYDIHSPEVKTAIQKNIDISIIDENHIDTLLSLIPKKTQLRVHLFVDTGINRAAVPYSKAIHVAKIIKGHNKFNLVGLMSHFIQSEIKNDKETLEQLRKFRELRNILEDKHNIKIPYVHIANSGGCLNYNVSDFTLSRPGSAIYGIHPSGKYTRELKPAMRLTSVIIQIKHISKGDGVGYDGNYITPKNIIICIIPIGYADILPRSSSGKLYVYINGTRRKVLGNISMDQIVVEGKSRDKIHDEVLLFGNPEKGDNQTVYDVANMSDTITNEVLVRTNSRVNIRYINV